MKPEEPAAERNGNDESIAAAAARATFSWTKKHVIEVLNLLALAGVLITIIYAHSQLREARRTAEVTSLFALKSDLGESNRRLYSQLPRVWELNGLDPQKVPLAALTTNLQDHLRTIEYSCSLFLDEMLGEKAGRFLEAVLREDLRFWGSADPMMGLYGDGGVYVDDDYFVEWVDPADPQPSLLYPRTLECANRLGVRIGAANP